MEITVETSRFGSVTVTEERVISFVHSMPGFEGLKRFILINHDEEGVFKWLQSAENPDIAFLLTDPTQYLKEYDVQFRKSDLKVPSPCHDVDRLPMYGMPTWGDAFTPRQLMALTTFSDLVQEAQERVRRDALAPGLLYEGKPLAVSGTGATAYADAVCVYLGFLVDQVANHSSSVCGWNSANAQMRSVFARQAITMVWDYAESNPFCDSSGKLQQLV